MPWYVDVFLVCFVLAGAWWAIMGDHGV